MMHSANYVHSWRRWLFGGYALVVVVMVVVWCYSIMVPIQSLIEQRITEGLVSVANATAVALQARDVPASEVLDRIAASDDLRLTLIDASGIVLAESADDGTSMQNHANRPEVAEALEGRQGIDKRVSKTDGIEYLYVTVPCTYDGKPAVVRVSRTMDQVNALTGAYLWTSLGLLFAALVMAVAVAGFASRRAGAPVRRLEHMRTDFVANASHELKTPVAGIRLLADSISQASQDGDMRIVSLLSERLDSESARLQRLVGDLMDLSRLENGGRTPAASVGCDVGAIVATSVEAHRPRAEAKGIALTLHDDVGLGSRVAMTATDALLVCDNLLSNALTYTEEGSVDVTLARDSSGFATLSVVDTGIGIEYAEQERVFERFYRVDTARSRENGGTGLGLSLVRHAVRRAQGTVELRSKPGVGSSFIVRLPLA